MKKDQAKKQIKKLSEQIEGHNYQYYNLDQPTVSDQEYDDLLKKLIQLEQKFPDLIVNNSPSQRVGTKLPRGTKTVKHQLKMYSLDNTYSIEELKDWEARLEKNLPSEKIEYVVELKIDGISAALTYENGELRVGATRGDGVSGEDVTHSLKTIRSIPLQLKVGSKEKLPELLEVRAEVYMNRKDFDQLNQQRKCNGETIFANPRNATSGSVKLLDSRITAERNLNCYIHSFGLLKGNQSFKTQWDFLKTIKKWGLCINDTSRRCKNLKEVIAYCQEYQERRDQIPYEVDGVVVKVNLLGQQERLGTTLKSPRWAVAYKFPAAQATTTIKKITVQIGRTGVLTPVAELKPVACAGVTISRATLHNFDEVNRLGVNVGDRILLERAGDVIPKIIQVVKKNSSSTFRIPKKCPECKGEVIKDSTDDVAYRCSNASCPKQLEKSLLHFSSRGAMDIEGLGESVVVQLLESGIVKDLADIYYLTKEDLLSLELFADKKADNLISAILESKSKPLSKFLFALGIANVGEKAAYILAQRFGSLDNLMAAKLEDFMMIHEIGEVIAVSVKDAFGQSQMKKLVKKFQKTGINFIEPKAQQVSSELIGKKFVFTGELEGISRRDAGDLVKKMGAEVLSSVSKKTDFVVAGEAAGSKYQKAVNLGIKILTQKEFKEMINE